MEERLQKIISQAGICSRRKAENLIESGRVFVNGEKAKLGDKADADKDKIEVSGKPLSLGKKVYYILNKPKLYLSENKKQKDKSTIYDLESVNSIGTRVMHVGRLDFMSEGLLVLTNDGDFANKIIHPRYALKKVYYVKAEPAFSDMDLRKLEEGMTIDNSEIECKVKKLSKFEIELDIHEGKNRIVRKLMEKLDKKVFRLVRIQIGPLELGDLKSGEVRPLTEEEIKDISG
jgi:pseudouridine synthase